MTTTSSTSKQGNGVATPTPTQDGMVGNCDAFHFVEPGQTCQTIASRYRITVPDGIAWNLVVGSDCTGL
ncbi:hypothetical protein DL770_002783 [Monosporascus sp. CRB-9-2]|nr:hypothetical protein DL770_002783 [Monosporascus sp. CRB-9-2]